MGQFDFEVQDNFQFINCKLIKIFVDSVTNHLNCLVLNFAVKQTTCSFRLGYF